jgi:HEAT repeat protein
MSDLFRSWFSAAAFMLVVSGVASASESERLIQQLASDDALARVEARQLLPRADVEVVPALLPLLSHPDADVWAGAYNVLSDFANEVSVPGRELERVAVTDSLMTLVSPKQSSSVKILGLRLLPIVIPEGYDVGPVAALLREPDLREKARTALQKTGTAKACKALVRALGKSDPQFQCALLDSLGQFDDGRYASRIRRYTRSPDPAVRVAAARALSGNGAPADRRAIRAVYAAAKGETAFNAGDAMIRVADTVALRYGDRRIATQLYREVLETAHQQALRGAAVLGLMRHGDETAVATIVAALDADDGQDLKLVVLTALEIGGGGRLRETLISAHPQLIE